MIICFFGVGGVGGYFGKIITDYFKEKHDICFVARGEHKNIICENGLTLKNQEENKFNDLSNLFLSYLWGSLY